MTVIAWDGKTLASDSLCSDEHGMVAGMTKKVFRLSSGAILGTAGDEDCRELTILLQNVKEEADLPAKKELEATRTVFDGILILPNKKAYQIQVVCVVPEFNVWQAEVRQINSKYYAVGHGMDFALTAMDLGKDAPTAVKAAIKRSLFCGGPVQVMTLLPQPKLPKAKRIRSKPRVDTEVSLEDESI